MADNHGNTPAAWTAVGVAMLGFLVGSIALMLSPISMVLFWVGIPAPPGGLFVRRAVVAGAQSDRA